MKFIASVGVWLALVQIVWACPMCDSGGPADYVRYGDGEKEVSPDGSSKVAVYRKLKQWSLSLDARTVGASEGPNDEDKHRQSQLGFTAAFRPNHQIIFFARMPFSSTSLIEANGHEFVNSGIGDAELLGTYEFITKSAWRPALTLGMKMPSGENDVQSEDSDAAFTRLEEHGQIGTGAWDGMIMAHLRKAGTYWVSSTLGYRVNGENDYGYRYGSVTWFDLSMTRSVSRNLSAGLGSRLRMAEKNKDAGESESDSGGTMFLLVPEIGYARGGDFNFSARCTLPVINQLNGKQSETPGLTVALTHSF